MTSHTPELVCVVILVGLLVLGLGLASLGLPPRAERTDKEASPDA